MTTARLQQYALFLAGFDYKIVYKNTTEHCNADGLSRPPLQYKVIKEMGVDSFPSKTPFGIQTGKYTLIHIYKFHRDTARDTWRCCCEMFPCQGEKNNFNIIIA